MQKFDPKIESVILQYHDRMAAEAIIMKNLSIEEGLANRDQFLLSIGEETATFLNILIKGAKSKTILEVGTSYGYSTIWLAEAAKYHGGKVISIENVPEKALFAQNQIEKAGLNDFVEIRLGDALDILERAQETFDFVLLDIWKEIYVKCFNLFFPKLAEDAIVVADNMIFPPNSKDHTDQYRKRIIDAKIFTSVLLPIGSGLEISKLIGKW